MTTTKLIAVGFTNSTTAPLPLCLSPPPPPPGPEEKGCTGSWGYQWCTEMVQPFTEGTAEDFYFCPNGTFYEAENCSAWDFEGASDGCVRQWGVTPRKEWARVMLGGKRIDQASNILFSNGEYDPWHNGGILANLSDTVHTPNPTLIPCAPPTRHNVCGTSGLRVGVRCAVALNAAECVHTTHLLVSGSTPRLTQKRANDWHFGLLSCRWWRLSSPTVPTTSTSCSATPPTRPTSWPRARSR